MFGIDMVVIFNTAILNEDQHEVTDRKLIAKEYLLSWFLIDFLSIFPIEVFVSSAVENEEANYDATYANRVARMSRISKLYRLAKITKLIRVFKILKSKKKIHDNVLANKEGHAINRLAYFILILFIFVHFFGCLWIYVGRIE